ncbi:MAG: sulfate ABC transporter substrate-binding protein [Synechococcaceae cyanobacterium SM2_3_2]|nr:sulfate ABC transporter substrate-binding protein [Synechococcaceae cyanobacterium SM2_3_2]
MALAAVGLTGCLGTSQPTTILLATYAVTRDAYEQIIPRFEEYWQTRTGERVRVESTYGGSAPQSRAVMDGLDADVVALALSLDVERIEAAGLIEPGWENRSPNQGIVTQSIAVIVTRPGNPLGIQDWVDLTEAGIEVVTANPKTSGGARWNFLAIWAAAPDSQALQFTTQLYRNVGILPRDAREATDVFLQKGQGDALITYEHEVILAGLRGQSLSYVVPSSSISIDNPVAVVDAIVEDKGTRAVAEGFVEFLFTPEAQQIFSEVGFRSVDPIVRADFAEDYPQLERLTTVAELGGWQTIQAEFFADGAIFDQIQSGL